MSPHFFPCRHIETQYTLIQRVFTDVGKFGDFGSLSHHQGQRSIDELELNDAGLLSAFYIVVWVVMYVTKYIYSSTVLEYFHFLLLYTSTSLQFRENIVLFTPQHLFDNFPDSDYWYKMLSKNKIWYTVTDLYRRIYI